MLLQLLQYLRHIGLGLILIGLFACRENANLQTLQPDLIQVSRDATGGGTSLPRFSTESLPFDSLDTFPDAESIWIRFPVGPINFVQPTLLLRGCRNILQVASDEEILYSAAVLPISLFNYANLKAPFVALPSTDITHLSLEIKRSPKTGMRPDCTGIYLSDETSAIRKFSTIDLPEVMIGYGLLILAGIYLAGALFLRHAPLFTAALVYCALAAYFIFGTPLPHFIHLNNREIYLIATLGLLSAPVLYFTLIYQLIERKHLGFLSYILISALLASLSFMSLISDLSSLARPLIPLSVAFSILGALSIMPFLVWQYRYSLKRSRRPFWLGVMALTVGMTLEALTTLLSRESLHMAALGGLLYAVGSTLALAKELFATYSRSHIKSRTDAEEFQERLEEEVRNRELSLLEKNRLFGEANTELEEKNVLLRLSYKRLDDLLLQQNFMLERAERIRKTILPELLACRDLKNQVHDNESLRNISLSIHKLSSALDPFVRLAESNNSNSNVWLLSTGSGITSAFHHALGSSLLKLEVFGSRETLLARLQESKPRLLFVNLEFKDLISELHENYPEIDIILSGEEDVAHAIDTLGIFPRINHFVAQPTDGPNTFMQKNLLVTATKIISNDIFGIEKYLDWGVTIKETIITGNSGRRDALKQLEVELAKSGLSTVFIRRARHLADELLMNAIYDAPIDQKTKLSRYNHFARSVDIELAPTEFARLRYAYDGTLLAISIDDPFGALERGVILKYLKSCFEGQFGKINEQEGKGGGGMGLYQIMSSADLLVTNVSPNAKTEIIAILHAHERTALKGHCFHYFIKR